MYMCVNLCVGVYTCVQGGHRCQISLDLELQAVVTGGYDFSDTYIWLLWWMSLIIALQEVEVGTSLSLRPLVCLQTELSDSRGYTDTMSQKRNNKKKWKEKKRMKLKYMIMESASGVE